MYTVKILSVFLLDLQVIVKYKLFVQVLCQGSNDYISGIHYEVGLLKFVILKGAMRYIRLLLATLIWLLTFSGTQVFDDRSLIKQLEYLFKAEMHCGEMGCSQRILIRQPPSKSLAESMTAIDDRTIMNRMHFTKEMRIQVLKE